MSDDLFIFTFKSWHLLAIHTENGNLYNMVYSFHVKAALINILPEPLLALKNSYHSLQFFNVAESWAIKNQN